MCNNIVIGKRATSEFNRTFVLGEDAKATKDNQMVIKVPGVDLVIEMLPEDAKALTDILFKIFGQEKAYIEDGEQIILRTRQKLEDSD